MRKRLCGPKEANDFRETVVRTWRRSKKPLHSTDNQSSLFSWCPPHLFAVKLPTFVPILFASSAFSFFFLQAPFWGNAGTGSLKSEDYSPHTRLWKQLLGFHIKCCYSLGECVQENIQRIDIRNGNGIDNYFKMNVNSAKRFWLYFEEHEYVFGKAICFEES